MLSEKIGELLKEQRLAKGVELEDVARALPLRLTLLEALEAGDFKSAGALVYTKSYLRKYAAYLELDQEEFEEMLSGLKEVDPLYRELDQTLKVRSEVATRRKSRRFRYYLFGLILLCGLTAFGIYIGVLPVGERESEEAMFRDELLTEPQIAGGPHLEKWDDAESVADSAAEELLELEQYLEEEVLADLEASRQAQEEREAALLEESERAEAIISQQRKEEYREEAEVNDELIDREEIVPGQLTIVVNDECWVSIKDGPRTLNESRLLTAGTHQFIGTPPYSVRVGNAQVVESIYIGGERVDEMIYRPTSSTVVKNFTIDAQEEEGE